MSAVQKIVPCLWFDDRAEEAAQLYVSVFGDAEVGETSRYGKTVAEVAGRPEGSVMTVSFRIGGQEFVALNGGPQFNFTPAISFFVSCADVREADELFARLSDGGSVLMPLQQYPFSEKYGWCEDRYGVSWQVNAAPRAHKISPCLMFVKEQCGRAEEAMQLHTSIFPDAGIDFVSRYGTNEEPNREGAVNHGVFSLAGQGFVAMDSALDHPFTFNEAISLQVRCETQEEIDRYWEKLGEGGDPKAQQCGWLKDRFGVSWQVVPTVLFDMLRDPDTRSVERVTKAFLSMKKFDIGALERARDGERP